MELALALRVLGSCLFVATRWPKLAGLTNFTILDLL
jgi:hypothetical protein